MFRSTDVHVARSITLVILFSLALCYEASHVRAHGNRDTQTSLRTRGSNSQLTLPNNATLADIDGDGIADMIHTEGAYIYGTKTDYERTRILAQKLERKIKRVLIGDFHGDGHSQICASTDQNVLECYGIGANKRELWWWFTQPAFTNNDEDMIVGDFNGDNREDVLVYAKKGAPFRMYSLKDGDAFFEPMPSWNQGNLANSVGKGMQIRAGDFDGNGRDDLIIVNSQGDVSCYGAVRDGETHTFWWGWTSTGLVTRDEQVTVARIDDNPSDDVVLRNGKTGDIRFLSIHSGDDVLRGISNVSSGQLYDKGNSIIVWARMHGKLDEAGSMYRDDALVFTTKTTSIHRSDARWDGENLTYTYWWAYTRHPFEAPKPPKQSKPSTPKPPTPKPQRPTINFDYANARLTGSNFNPNSDVLIQLTIGAFTNLFRQNTFQTRSNGEGNINISLYPNCILSNEHIEIAAKLTSDTNWTAYNDTWCP